MPRSRALCANIRGIGPRFLWIIPSDDGDHHRSWDAQFRKLKGLGTLEMGFNGKWMWVGRHSRSKGNKGTFCGNCSGYFTTHLVIFTEWYLHYLVLYPKNLFNIIQDFQIFFRTLQLLFLSLQSLKAFSSSSRHLRVH